MRPLRVLHVTPYWADAWAYGGIPRVVGAFARQFAAAGHAVTVCATDACSGESRLDRRDAPASRRTPWPAQTLDDGLELRVFPNRSNRLAYDWQWFTATGLGRYLRDHAREFDIAHLHACRNWPGVVAAHHLRAQGVPYVLAPNGTAPVLERRHAAKHLFDLVAGRRLMRDAAAVIAVSEAERRQLLALGVPADRIHLVPNPVDLDEFAPALGRGRFRRDLAIGDAPLLAFLGKVTPRKRLDVLVRAFAGLPASGRDPHLIIAGNDMGGLEDARAVARTLGVASRVHVTGLLAGHDRLDVLADADVVVYPSEDEVFGLVALEAILAGTPVVVSGDSGCGEVVTAVGGGLVVPPGDAPVLQRAVSTILDDAVRWRESIATAAQRVRQAFGHEAVSAELLRVYRHLVVAGHQPARVPAGVSVVIPVRNGAATIARTIASIVSQADGRPIEILVIDDRSTDESPAILKALADTGTIRLLAGAGRGASAAMNLGLRAAAHPLVCQIDQDVELLPGWMSRVIATLEHDPRLAAVQGHYTTNRASGLIARAMGLDLELRYAALQHGETGHVCTGNTAYRAAALREVGLFDESLGYGNDNDMSYRLREAGWRLAHCRQARSLHRWRDGLLGYARQQYGFGYGRLDLVAKHPRRVAGDSVSPASMMVHPIVMFLTTVGFIVAMVQGAAGADWRAAAATGAGLALLLMVERAVAGIRAFWRFGDPAALTFPVLHLVRDAAWVAAIVRWTSRRVRGRVSRPSDSMRERPATSRAPTEPVVRFVPTPTRTLGVIPAHNEAATIAVVVADIRACCPDLDLLVVDDGSTDGTDEILHRIGVRWLQLPERMGVGRAVRAGLRYGRRQGYDSAIRLDGDGQHGAEDIASVLAPLREGRADAVLGSRFMIRSTGGPRIVRAAQRALAMCLSALTRRAVTDPTSGFCALGPRAMRLLADHHPTGYPEPELRLFLSRNDLVAVEVPVESRPRLGGRTSLTMGRITAAGARVLLAMLIVPLRRAVHGAEGD